MSVPAATPTHDPAEPHQERDRLKTVMALDQG